MKKLFCIKLDESDLGQEVDGLEVRATAWEDTAHYPRTGEAREQFFLPEECNEPEEASRLATHYRSILRKIRRQAKRQR